MPAALSVVVPCYNEADGVPQLKERLLPVLERLAAGGRPVDLLLVDDGSRDNTHDLLCAAFAGRPSTRVVRHERNLNLGAAIRTGVRETRGEWIAFLDSDCTYDPAALEGMVAALEAGADLATVSPYHPKGKVEGVPPYRLLLSRGASLIYRILLRRRIYTYTAMVRAMRRETAVRSASPASDFSAVAEMMLKALKQGRRVAEIPATLSLRRFGESKMKTARVIRAHLRLIARLLFRPSSFLA
jgi:dolichol-phosphate mannosyltransferase